jgi:epoxyqueuosine reductase
MKAAVHAKARDLGFDLCRITSAAPPESAEHFRDWLRLGKEGAMGYLARNAEKRADPRLVLPGARSIICLACSYGSTASEAQRWVETSHGVVARYAHHSDYHDVLAAPLKALSEFVNDLGGAGTRSLWYVDTGPILERDLAQRAGIGFIGKHTNVVSRSLGNWLLLAEILTTAELEPDEAEKNRCGTCSRCISACPTQAILAPFDLDARRCISYLTIELKGSIPTDLRPLIGNRVFGCDDCLAACPWNRFARAGMLMRSQAREDIGHMDLLGLLALDEADFKQKFAGTPVLRSRRRGLLRNVCVALGNVAGQEALPPLERAAQDPEPLIEEHAAWAIDQIRKRFPDQRPEPESTSR